MLAPSIRSAILATPWFRTGWAPCVLLDAELRISAVNAAAAAAVHRAPEALRDQPLFEMFPEPDGSPGRADRLGALARAGDERRRGVTGWAIER